jgi:hypothetical protein
MQAGGVHGWLATIHGAAYALALELAVLLFVVQGHRRASYAFAGVSVLVNLAYYAERVQLNSVQGLSAWLISVALPVAIALYSHAVADAQGGFDVGAWLKSWRKVDATPDAMQVQPETPVEDDVCEDTQPVEIDSTLPAQLDEMNARIIASISAGNYTPYAIHKDTGIALTTLKRKQGDTYSGRIPQLVAQGVIHNSSGEDGNEYRLVNA